MSITTVERPIEGSYSGQFNTAKIHSSAADHRARYQFAAETFARSQATSLGDMGCGTGESTSYLSELMIRLGLPLQMLLGVDISPEAVEKANLRNIPNTRFLSADLTSPDLEMTVRDTIPNLPLLGGVVFAETLEHISPPSAAAKALANLRDLLEPNTGRLIITSPNRMLTSTHRYKPLNPYHAQEYYLE